MPYTNHLRRIRICLGIFIAGLVVSGITAFPLETELRWLLGLGMVQALPAPMLGWLERVSAALKATNAQYPFLVIPLALISGPIRGIPIGWRLIDCSFGVFGCIPLLVCRQSIRALEAHSS